ALKIVSTIIGHKSDIGGVKLNLVNDAQLTSAYSELDALANSLGRDKCGIAVQSMAAKGVELIVGIIRDPGLGAAVVVGSGGIFVGIMDDAVVGIAPFTHADALAMLTSLKASALMKGARGGAAADLDAAARLLAKLGDRASAMPASVQPMDLNPV